MEKSLIMTLYGLTKLEVVVYFLDRGLRNSRRSLGSLSLKESVMPCVHPDCEGGCIRFRRQLRETISRLKQQGERLGTFVIACRGSKRGVRGRLTCGGFYLFEIEIDYGATAGGRKKTRSGTRGR